LRGGGTLGEFGLNPQPLNIMVAAADLDSIPEFKLYTKLKKGAALEHHDPSDLIT